MTKKINCYVIFEMDCESVASDTGRYHPGPHSWADSRDNINEFVNILKLHEIRPILLIVPDMLKNNHDFILSLSKRVLSIGLHLHTNINLGLQDHDNQYELIKKAKEDYFNIFGFDPVMFKAGYYSANKDTFLALSKLGFKYSSNSVARRNIKYTGALWSGHPTQPYLINGLIEFPITSHPIINLPVVSYEVRSFIRKMVFGNGGFGMSAKRHAHNLYNYFRILSKKETLEIKPLDLQIEHRDIFLLKKILADNIAEHRNAGVDEITFVCTTHNDVPYAKPRNRFKKTLEAIILYLNNRDDIDVTYTTPNDFASKVSLIDYNNTKDYQKA